MEASHWDAHQLVHGYFDVSHRIIWHTINEDIPKLIIHLEKALSLKK